MIPAAFAQSTIDREGEAGAAWLAELPGIIEELLSQWGCVADGAGHARPGRCDRAGPVACRARGAQGVVSASRQRARAGRLRRLGRPRRCPAVRARRRALRDAARACAAVNAVGGRRRRPDRRGGWAAQSPVVGCGACRAAAVGGPGRQLGRGAAPGRGGLSTALCRTRCWTPRWPSSTSWAATSRISSCTATSIPATSCAANANRGWPSIPRGTWEIRRTTERTLLKPRALAADRGRGPDEGAAARAGRASPTPRSSTRNASGAWASCTMRAGCFPRATTRLRARPDGGPYLERSSRSWISSSSAARSWISFAPGGSLAVLVLKDEGRRAAEGGVLAGACGDHAQVGRGQRQRSGIDRFADAGQQTVAGLGE